MAFNLGAVLSLRDNNFSSNLNKAGKGVNSFQNKVLHAQNGMKRFEKSVGSAVMGVVGKIGGLAAAYIGFSTAKQFISDAINSAMENEKIMAQTGAVLKSTGGIAGMTKDSIKGLTDQLNMNATMSKGAIVEGENLMLTFTNIGKKVFPQAAQTMLDMSQALGQDTKNSAMQLGKALNDPTRGITALRRVGVAFTKQQEDQIKKMQKSGNVIGAQKIILAELNKEFGGSAKAQTKTYAGQLIMVEKQMKSLRSQIGLALLPVVKDTFTVFLGWMPTIKAGITKTISGVKLVSGVIKTDVVPVIKLGVSKLNEMFNSPQVQQGITWISSTGFPAVKTGIGEIITKSKEFYNFVKDNWSTIGPLVEGIAIAWGTYKAYTLAAQGASVLMTAAQWALNVAMNANPIGLVITGIGLLIGAGILLYKNWDKVKDGASALWAGIKSTFVSGVNFAIDRLNDLIVGLNQLPGVNIALVGRVQGAFGQQKRGSDRAAGHNASGTSFWRGGPTWVGEKGPEIINLPRGSQVIPNNKVSSTVSKAAPKVEININGYNKSTHEIINELVPQLKLALANM